MEKMYRVKFLRRDPFTDKIMSDTVQTIRTKSLTKAIEEYKWLSKATKEFALENHKKPEFRKGIPFLLGTYREVWIEVGIPQIKTIKKYEYNRINNIKDM